MKNYNKSDYALNKYSKSIVYRFADGIVEVTLKDYLTENPDKTEKDFQALKELSDVIYLEQLHDEYNQTWKNTPIYELEDMFDPDSVIPEEQYLDSLEKLEALKAFDAFLSDKTLTEIQKRRFHMHFFENMSFRQIAKLEGKAIRAIQQSVYAAADKLKKYFNFF